MKGQKTAPVLVKKRYSVLRKSTKRATMTLEGDWSGVDIEAYRQALNRASMAFLDPSYLRKEPA